MSCCRGIKTKESLSPSKQQAAALSAMRSTQQQQQHHVVTTTITTSTSKSVPLLISGGDQYAADGSSSASSSSASSVSSARASIISNQQQQQQQHDPMRITVPTTPRRGTAGAPCNPLTLTPPRGQSSISSYLDVDASPSKFVSPAKQQPVFGGALTATPKDGDGSFSHLQPQRDNSNNFFTASTTGLEQQQQRDTSVSRPTARQSTTTFVRKASDYGGMFLLREFVQSGGRSSSLSAGAGYLSSDSGSSSKSSSRASSVYPTNHGLLDHFDSHSGAIPLSAGVRSPSVHGAGGDFFVKCGANRQGSHFEGLPSLTMINSDSSSTLKNFSFMTPARTSEWRTKQESLLKAEKQQQLNNWVARFEGDCGRRAISAYQEKKRQRQQQHNSPSPPPRGPSFLAASLTHSPHRLAESAYHERMAEKKKKHQEAGELVQLLERDVGGGRPGLANVAWGINALVEEAANYSWRRCYPFIVAYYYHQVHGTGSDLKNKHSSDVKRRVAEAKKDFRAGWTQLRQEIRAVLCKQAAEEVKKVKNAVGPCIDTTDRHQRLNCSFDSSFDGGACSDRLNRSTHSISSNISSQGVSPTRGGGLPSPQRSPARSLLSSFFGGGGDSGGKKCKKEATKAAHQYYDEALAELEIIIGNDKNKISTIRSKKDHHTDIPAPWSTFDLLSTWSSHLHMSTGGGFDEIVEEKINCSPSRKRALFGAAPLSHDEQMLSSSSAASYLLSPARNGARAASAVAASGKPPTANFDIARRLQLLWLCDVALVLPQKVYEFFHNQHKEVSSALVRQLKIPVVSCFRAGRPPRYDKNNYHFYNHRNLTDTYGNDQDFIENYAYYRNFPEDFGPRDELTFRRIPTFDIVSDEKIQQYRTRRFTRITKLREQMLARVGTTLSRHSSRQSDF